MQDVVNPGLHQTDVRKTIFSFAAESHAQFHECVCSSRPFLTMGRDNDQQNKKRNT